MKRILNSSNAIGKKIRSEGWDKLEAKNQWGHELYIIPKYISEDGRIYAVDQDGKSCDIFAWGNKDDWETFDCYWYEYAR